MDHQHDLSGLLRQTSAASTAFGSFFYMIFDLVAPCPAEHSGTCRLPFASESDTEGPKHCLGKQELRTLPLHAARRLSPATRMMEHQHKLMSTLLSATRVMDHQHDLSGLRCQTSAARTAFGSFFYRIFDRVVPCLADHSGTCRIPFASEGDTEGPKHCLGMQVLRTLPLHVAHQLSPATRVKEHQHELMSTLLSATRVMDHQHDLSGLRCQTSAARTAFTSFSLEIFDFAVPCFADHSGAWRLTLAGEGDTEGPKHDLGKSTSDTIQNKLMSTLFPAIHLRDHQHDLSGLLCQTSADLSLEAVQICVLRSAAARTKL